MAPERTTTFKTYSRKHIGNRRGSSSVQVVNDLFAENLFKRKASRKPRKRQIKIKELPPPDENHHLLEDSLSITWGLDDTFDRLRKATVFSKGKSPLIMKASNQSTSNTNKSTVSVSTTDHSPFIHNTRSRKKLQDSSADSSQTNTKQVKTQEKTLDKSVNISLLVEKVPRFPAAKEISFLSSTSNVEQNVSHLRNYDPTEISYEPLFSSTFRERVGKKLHIASTPAVASSTPSTQPCVINETMSPILNNTQLNSFVESNEEIKKWKIESYEEIKKWNVKPPNFEQTSSCFNITPKVIKKKQLQPKALQKRNDNDSIKSKIIKKKLIEQRTEKQPLYRAYNDKSDWKLKAEVRVMLDNSLDIMGIEKSVKLPVPQLGFAREQNDLLESKEKIKEVFEESFKQLCAKFNVPTSPSASDSKQYMTLRRRKIVINHPGTKPKTHKTDLELSTCKPDNLSTKNSVHKTLVRTKQDKRTNIIKTDTPTTHRNRNHKNKQSDVSETGEVERSGFSEQDSTKGSSNNHVSEMESSAEISAFRSSSNSCENATKDTDYQNLNLEENISNCKVTDSNNHSNCMEDTRYTDHYYSRMEDKVIVSGSKINVGVYENNDTENTNCGLQTEDSVSISVHRVNHRDEKEDDDYCKTEANVKNYESIIIIDSESESEYEIEQKKESERREDITEELNKSSSVLLNRTIDSLEIFHTYSKKYVDIVDNKFIETVSSDEEFSYKKNNEVNKLECINKVGRQDSESESSDDDSGSDASNAEVDESESIATNNTNRYISNCSTEDQRLLKETFKDNSILCASNLEVDGSEFSTPKKTKSPIFLNEVLEKVAKNYVSTISNTTAQQKLDCHQDKDTFAAPSLAFKIQQSRYSLKAGKSWRRSLMALQKQSVLDLEMSDVGICLADNGCACTCHKCRTKESPVARRMTQSRRLTIKVIPESPLHAIQLKLNPTILENYALHNLNTTYGSNITQDLVYQERSVGEPHVVKNNSIHEPTLIIKPSVTAREIVLRRCGQTEPLPFTECYPDSMLQHCFKIGEGLYGEVFLFRNPKAEGTTVIKVIPIEGSQTVNGESQKKFDEILSEIVIAMELSDLRNDTKNRTSGFSHVKKIRCVQGCYPDRLLELWELYDETHNSENESPEMFADDQLYIVLELANGGRDMEAFEFNNAVQAFTLFKQTACSLAVAESSLQFEHRDLHWGNILISQTDLNKKLTYCLDGQEFQVATGGIEVSIIDFTLSRITYDGVCIFNDLSSDPELFDSSGDYQFEIYKLMQQKNNNEWQHFEPYSNVLWLHYVLDKMVTVLRYKNTNSKVHKEAIGKLRQLKNRILKYSNVRELINGEFL